MYLKLSEKYVSSGQLLYSISFCKLCFLLDHIHYYYDYYYYCYYFASLSLINLPTRNGHMLTHRNKKPYECKAEGCGKSYCDARSLRRHTENHHSIVATAPTTPNQSISSTGPLGNLSLSPATASGKHSTYLCGFFFSLPIRHRL